MRAIGHGKAAGTGTRGEASWDPGAPNHPEPQPVWGLRAELLSCAIKQRHEAILWGPCVNRSGTMPTWMFALLLLGLR